MSKSQTVNCIKQYTTNNSNFFIVHVTHSTLCYEPLYLDAFQSSIIHMWNMKKKRRKAKSSKQPWLDLYDARNNC